MTNTTMKTTMMKNTIKTYSELITFDSFEDRYDYLKLDGKVAHETFGAHRWLNQNLYTSSKWKRIRREILIRDNGCDLALEGYDIDGKVFIHHINPITIDDIRNDSYNLYDPENLVCVSKRTHDMLHYGNPGDRVYSSVIERTPNDTCPWRRRN